MYQFNVPDMTCGHCVRTITKAVKAQDPNARIEILLAEHLVKVESALSKEQIGQRISEAGYTPKAI
jgi:copper chaperone